MADRDDNRPTLDGSSASPAAVRSGSTPSSSPSSAPNPSNSDSPTLAPGISRSVPVLQPGNVLAGRYEIVQMLGEGGMGAVYKAKDLELERFVAVKVIRAELASRSDIVRRFKQELILARQITHRNVVRIYDLNEAAGWKFITMEYVEGHNLREYVQQKGKLQPAEATEIVLQICYALEAAHSEEVIHRDLKPQNVMRDQRGRIIVMDFGLARSIESDGGFTMTGALVGTLEYMSPEQALGKHLGAQSDLFTLGIIFYELLTGKLPYAAESAVASLVKRTTERVRPPKDIDSSVPDVLSSIVQKCLELEPEKRHQSATELAQELETWLGRKPFTASATGSVAAAVAPAPSSAAARPKRKRNLVIALIAAAILSIGLGFGVYRWNRKPVAQKAISVLLADFRNDTGDPLFDGTLEPALSIALEDAAMVSAYNRNQARQIATQLRPGSSSLTEELARIVAGREGINVVISGTIVRNGENYSTTLKAVDAATGKQIASRSIDATGKQEVLAAMGKLAATVRNALGDKTPESVQIAAAETFGASSLEAAHAYSTAQELQWGGKWDEAISQYKQAVQLDPNLGRAYAGLAALSGNMGKRQQAVEYYKLAMSHIDRMSDREKYRTRGGYFLTIHDPEKAVEQYNALVQQFPADVAGHMNLALAYFYMRDMPKAMKFGKRAVEISHNGLFQRNNVALYDVYAGEYDAAVKEASSIISENQAYVDAYGALAMAQVGKGQPDEAVATYGKLKAISARGASMSAIGLADVGLYRGHIAEAIATLEQGVTADLASKENELAGLKLATLAEAYSESGNNAKALEAASKAITLNKTEHTLFAAGRVFAKAKDNKKTSAVISQLNSNMEPEPQAYAKILEGEVHLAQGDPRGALKLFSEAQKSADTWWGRFELGRGYLDAQMFTEAYSELENCLKRRGEASAVFLDDVPSFRLLPELHYFLGRAQEGLHSPGAADSFRSFLTIQQGGDAPRIADVRHRLNLN